HARIHFQFSIFNFQFSVPNRLRLPVVADVDVDDLSFGDGLALAAAANDLDHDLRRNRGIADAESLGPEADEVTDEDRLVKHDLVHRDGDHELQALPARFDRASLVDVGKDHAAEDRAVR